jgi:hypothetical protein
MSSINNRPHTLPATPAASDHAASGDTQDQAQSQQQHSGADTDNAKKGTAAHTAAVRQRLGASEAEIVPSIRVARAPGNPEAVPTVQTGTQGVQLSTQHAAVAFVPTANDTLTFKGDRTGGMATLNHTDQGAVTSGSAGILAGNAYVEAGHQFASGDKIAIGALNGAGVHAVGATFTHTVGNTAVNFGVFAVGNASIKARVTETRGSEALVTYTDKSFKALQLAGGASSGLVGGGVRLYGASTKEIQLQRWVDKAAAYADGDRSKTLFQKKKLALGLSKTPLFVMPDLKNPNSASTDPAHLQVNDKVTIVTTGTLTGGVASALGGVYLSAHLTSTRDWILRVNRVSENQIEVSLSPSKNKTWTGGIAADLPLVGTLSATRSKGTSQLITYLFDVTGENGESGLRAYRDMLDLKLPENSPVIAGGLLGNSKNALATLADTTALPAGVSFESMQQVVVPRQDTIIAGITGPRALIGSKIGSLSIKLQKELTQSAWATGAQVYEKTEAKRAWSTEAFRPGPTTISGSAAHILTTSAQPEGEAAENALSTHVLAHDDSVQLEAEQTFAAPKSQAQMKLAQWANNLGFIDADPATFKENKVAKNYSYGMVIKRSINTDELIQLATSYGLEGAASLQEKLNDPQANKRLLLGPPIAFLQGMVRKDGVKAISDIHQILGANADSLEVSFKSNSEEKLTAEVDKTLNLFAPKIRSRNIKGDVAFAALKATEKLQNKIAKVLESHYSDRFMQNFSPIEYDQKSKNLVKVSKKMNSLIDLNLLTSSQQMMMRVVATKTKMQHVLRDSSKNGNSKTNKSESVEHESKTTDAS